MSSLWYKTVSNCKKVFPAFVIRVVILYLLIYGCYVFTLSLWLQKFLVRNLVAPGGYAVTGIQWLGFLLLLFLIIERKSIKKVDLRPPTTKELLWGLGSFLFVLGISIAITHPPQSYHPIIAAFMNQNPTFGGALVGSLLGTALTLTFLSATLLILPAQFYKFRWNFLYIVLQGVLYISILESLYYSTFAPTLIQLIEFFSSFFHERVFADAKANVLAMGDFIVRVGPACAGMGFLLLFMFFFAYLLSRLSKKYHINRIKAAIVFVAGIVIVFVLNAFRIASIMFVGTKNPEFALNLFHGASGAILFFLFFLVLLPVLQYWVCDKKPHQ
ncbi:MAG TPA: archaeosortase/exosortase family protein [Candidatus Gracilibacteria bacterium]